jgi:hypothetical protein
MSNAVEMNTINFDNYHKLENHKLGIFFIIIKQSCFINNNSVQKTVSVKILPFTVEGATSSSQFFAGFNNFQLWKKEK